MRIFVSAAILFGLWGEPQRETVVLDRELPSCTVASCEAALSPQCDQVVIPQVTFGVPTGALYFNAGCSTVYLAPGGTGMWCSCDCKTRTTQGYTRTVTGRCEQGWVTVQP